MNIKLDFLPKNTTIAKGFTYADLHLDLKSNILINKQLHKTPERTDLIVDYDLNAIRNALYNLFTTSPGEKVLNPEFGVDLRYFLFEPVSEDTAKDIADLIFRKIPLFDPRIVIDNMKIEVVPDEQQYNISFRINVPTLQITGLTIDGKLNKDGYVSI